MCYLVTLAIMVESVIVTAWVFAAWRAARGRHLLAIGGAIVIGFVIAAGTLAAVRGLDQALPALHWFIVIFIGPRAASGVSAPILARMVNVGIALTVLLVCNRQNSELNPLDSRSQMLDKISGPFLLLGILEMLLVVQMLLVGALAAD